MLDQITTNTRLREIENEFDKLKLENSKLNGTVEELNAQLMIANGRVLMSSSMNKSDSFAAELGNSTKVEDHDVIIQFYIKKFTFFKLSFSFCFKLLEKYKLEKESNKRLQEYIDGIISTIMDHNPEILEINSNKRKKADKR